MKRNIGSTSRSGRSGLPGGRLAVSLVAAAPVIGAWLFLAALPALADGGPHVSSVNSGSSTLTADSCAGCHRAHTAQGPMLLTEANEEELCLSCHGATAGGATTDVASGLQYRTTGRGTTPLLGALRNGGFVNAAIRSDSPSRVLTVNDIGSSDDQWAKVQVRIDGTGAVAPAPVTSAHLNLVENGLTAPEVAWGNGDVGLGLSGPGPTVKLSCASCHNPHGNGQYRILNPIPTAEGAGFDPVPTTVISAPVTVTDTPVDNPDATEADTKNYTVIQTRGTPGDLNTYLIYADDVIKAPYAATTGDYWHVRVPWNQASTGVTGADAPNGIPANRAGGFVAFNTQITNWCTACHTRYKSDSAELASGDAVFMFGHETVGNRACTTCHVSHGSNAVMTGPFASVFPYPDDPGGPPAATTSASSRLLKVDGRGTCQLCHDPTGTAPTGIPAGPTPTPGVP